jgi:hypothetical protein
MSTKTPKTTLFSNKNARSRQAKSAESRLRKNNHLRKRFATLLGPPGLLDAFSLLLTTARPSDLKRSWAFGSGQSVFLTDSEKTGMRSLGTVFVGDADDIGEVPMPDPGAVDALLAELDAMPT